MTLESRQRDLINIDEVSRMLKVSKATTRNWIKSKKIRPFTSPKFSGSGLLFLKKDIESLLEDIKKGKENRLKSRRNKNHVSGVLIPKAYLHNTGNIKTVEEIISQLENMNLFPGYKEIILAEYSLKLLVKRQLVTLKGSPDLFVLPEYLADKEKLGPYKELIADILSPVSDLEAKIESLKKVLSKPVSFDKGQDFLGLLYMSLQNLGERKPKGVYYTPLTVVQDAFENLKTLNGNTRLLDPCCGTGNFLISAYEKSKNLAGIYGYDINPLSISLTRINMALISKTTNIELLYKNFICKNSLLSKENFEFDIIIGNPPWGYKYTQEEEKRIRRFYKSVPAGAIESFCVFTEYALKTVVPGGLICFILPQALLNVGIHQPLRDYLLGISRPKRIRYWENIFDGVQCPAMTLVLEKRPGFNTSGMEVVTDRRKFTIQHSRNLERNNWHFNVTDSELSLKRKIEKSVPVTYLKDKADFALGIVTGANAVYVSKTPFKGAERVLRGSEVFKYKLIPQNNYLKLEPEKFQQVAPLKFYRASEKLIYRFIGNKLIFAYDNNQFLTLNSANILIPRIPDLSIKYILAILNSSVLQYYFQMKYKTLKILRSQLENLPIPLVDPKLQSRIIQKVDNLLVCQDSAKWETVYRELDVMISALFGLTEEDYKFIENSLSSKVF